jgi:SNF2 family DNA or RNA helicase
VVFLTDTKVNNVPIFALRDVDGRDIGPKASKILGASYDLKSNCWYYPSYYPFGQLVYDEIHMLFSDVRLDPSVDTRLKQLQKAKLVIDKRAFSKDFKFKTTPMDHQIEGLVYGLTHLRLALYWECGTGKSKAAIDITRYLKINTLYVCPARLVENTANEFRKHSFDGEIDVYPIVGKLGPKDKKDLILKCVQSPSPLKVMIVGYETVIKKSGEESPYFDLISQFDYQQIIFDECQKLRVLDSETSSISSKLASKAYRRIIMSGTPGLGSPLHLYVQLRVLMPFLYQNYWKYKSQFVEVSPYNPKIVIGYKNLHILRKKVGMFALQKTKEECLTLPERTVITIPIQMSKQQEKLYEEVKAGIHTSVEYNPIAILIMGKLHQITGGTLVNSPIDLTICDNCPNMSVCISDKIIPFSSRCTRKDIERPIEKIILEDNPKLGVLEEMLDSIIVEGRKVIVWYKYELEHEIITKMFKHKKYKYVDYAKGQSAVDLFQDDESYLIFLGQIQQSSGITLTAATYMIFYSHSFDLEHYAQARDRIYRAGQTKKTTEYQLVVSNTIDDIIMTALNKKEEVNYAMLKQDLLKEMKTKVRLRS